MDNIYTVSALTDILRKTVEERFPFVWVRGEVTGVSRPQSGHIYFALKDARAQLQCAWFAGRQRRLGQKFDPLTGEVYETPPLTPLEMARNGVELLCAGHLDIYAPKGQYQLLVEFAQPAGAGLLSMEFEARKARLAALGYFASERKRPLPAHPACIALITSRHGAAIHDFLEISRSRGIASRIRLYPVQVQGQGAAEKMAEAIGLANAQNWADVIVLIRGGGSMEDLWAFNEECLAKAIFDSGLPVLAGIGHEVDVTLADMTADVRAATPTHAAQLLWQPRNELWQCLDSLQLALDRCLNMRLEIAQKKLGGQIDALRFLSPARKLARLNDKLNACQRQLGREMGLRVEQSLRRLAGSERQMVREVALNLENAAKRLHVASCSLRKAHGISCKLSDAESRLDLIFSSLAASFNAVVIGKKFALNGLDSRLRALDPGAPLRRGYALLHGKNGIVKSIAQTWSGDVVEAELWDGRLVVNVERKMDKRDAILQGNVF